LDWEHCVIDPDEIAVVDRRGRGVRRETGAREIVLGCAPAP